MKEELFKVWAGKETEKLSKIILSNSSSKTNIGED